ncbi:urea transporter [Tundrisphaera sp. TA3]|uniref:urea transporter n=1 Tax=Tundrisphaera sp. TA3 TaxID=3435775 RepID=UPI003EB9FDE4
MDEPDGAVGGATPAGGATDPLDAAKACLRGLGQIMFQGHAGTGLLFLAGIAFSSPWMALGAVLGSAIGMAGGRLMGGDRGEIADGIYGFNAALVGIALPALCRPDARIWVLALAGTVLATALTRLARGWVPFPTYTAPFVLATWAVLALAHAVGWTDLMATASPKVADRGLLGSALDGLAEVMLGANPVTGSLFLAGIALSNWRHAAIALLGSLVGTMVGIYHHDPSISAGLVGFNAALAAMAVYLWRPSLLGPILAAIVSVPLAEFFPKVWGIPALTAPFIVVTWAVLCVGALEDRFVAKA